MIDAEIEALKIRVGGLEAAIKEMLEIMRLHSETVGKLNNAVRSMIDRVAELTDRDQPTQILHKN